VQTLTPNLYVSSIEEAVEFYGRIGFGLEFAMNGENGRMMHASVQQGEVRFMFGSNCEGYAVDRRGAGSPELYINLADVDAYFDRVRGSGAEILEEVTDQFWGDRTFTIRDPWGHILTFAQTVRAFDPTMMPSAAPAAV
jgi:PhnB protein